MPSKDEEHRRQLARDHEAPRRLRDYFRKSKITRRLIDPKRHRRKKLDLAPFSRLSNYKITDCDEFQIHIKTQQSLLALIWI